MHYDQQPTPAREYVGRILAYFRQQAGLTQAELGRRIYCTDSLVAHMEKGRRPAAQPWLDRADNVLGAGGLLSAAMDLLSYDRNTPLESAHPELHIDVAAMHHWATHIVPDLLQTPEYAREIRRHQLPPLTSQDIDKALANLDRQQKVLHTTPRPTLNFILDEAVLRRRVGGRTVMRAQIDHLLACAELPYLTIQLAPLDHGCYPGLTRPTTLIHTPTDRTLVFVEGYDGTAHIRERERVISLTEHYNLIRTHALPPAQTAVALRKIADEL
jgi:transcriptional regulator with XRE-family HTH domain